MRSPARVSSEASASSSSRARSPLVDHAAGRAVGHRRRAVGPQPDALGRFPLLVAQEQLRGARRLAPVDAAGGVARLVGAELPEGLADADPPAAMHALGDGRGDALGGDQQRRQPVGQALGALALRRSGSRRVAPAAISRRSSRTDAR